MKPILTPFLVLILLLGTLNPVLATSSSLLEKRNSLQQKLYQQLNNSSSVRNGKVLYRNNTQTKSFNYKNTDPIQAWLDGYGPLTKEVENALSGKIILQMPQIQEPELKARTFDYQEQVLPSITVHAPKDSELEYASLSIWLVSVDDGPLSTCSIYYYEMGEAAEPWRGIRSGKYDVVAFAALYKDSTPYGMATIKKTFDISLENPYLELSFDEVKNEVFVQTYLPNGDTFPFKTSEEDVDYANCYGSLSVSRYQLSLSIFGSGDFHFLCNDLPEEASYCYSLKYASPQGELYMINDIIDGPFDKDVNKVLDSSLYKTFDANICLTPKDMESEFAGPYCRLGVISPKASFESGGGIVTGNNEGGHVSVNTILPENYNHLGDEEYYLAGVFLGRITDLYYGEPVVKQSGYMVKEENNTILYQKVCLSKV